jgi:hypothetical protein
MTWEVGGKISLKIDHWDVFGYAARRGMGKKIWRIARIKTDI